MFLFAGQQSRCRPREQTCGHSGGRRGRDEFREQHWDTYVTICNGDSRWEFAVWHREPKSGALWPRRGVGRRGKWEGGSRGPGCVYACGWFMLMYSRNQYSIVITLQLKIKLNFKNLYINICMWNLGALPRGWDSQESTSQCRRNIEKWSTWSYLQSRNRDRCREQTHGHQGRRRGGGMNWEMGIDTRALLILCVKQTRNESLRHSTEIPT